MARFQNSYRVSRDEVNLQVVVCRIGAYSSFLPFSIFHFRSDSGESASRNEPMVHDNGEPWGIVDVNCDVWWFEVGLDCITGYTAMESQPYHKLPSPFPLPRSHLMFPIYFVELQHLIWVLFDTEIMMWWALRSHWIDLLSFDSIPPRGPAPNP